MSREERYHLIDDLFNKFKQTLKSNDFTTIKDILKLTETAENEFLSRYPRRKREGVYYTDSEISKFMFNESLLLFLNKQLDFDPLKNIETIYTLETSNKNKLYNILCNLRICDPACGSGVFLLSSANSLFHIIRTLNSNIDDRTIKDKILKNIYGFDINEYAIKLSVLKLFDWAYQERNDDVFKILDLLEPNLKIKNSLTLTKIPKFDIILSNPPYGNILTRSEKEIYKREKIYHDIYCVFLMRALEWCNGIIALLVPKSFLLRQGYVEFRRTLLSNANILKIFDIGSKLFKKATNEVQIIIYENKNKTNHDIKNLEIYDYPNKHIVTYPEQDVDKLRICFNLECPLNVNSKKLYVYTTEKNCPYCDSRTLKLNRIRIKPNNLIYQLINKIEFRGDLNYLNHIKFPRMIRGEENKGLKHVKSNLKKDLKGSCYFISAKDDFRYYYLEKKRSFNIQEISDTVLKGNNYEYYISPKLLIKHNNIIPEAIFTEENICFTSSVYSLLHDDPNELKFLCAIFNSLLMQFYCIYGINNQNDTTINLNQYMIRHLPIVNPDGHIKSEIVKKTEIILNLFEARNGEMNEEIAKILRDIDYIIFNLYPITDKERKIIIDEVKSKIDYFNIIYSNFLI
ncbi:MAG: hypothetical protein EU532_05930 [Promethearchaeota archaeon]|nr:MAG: hypothetical protein EU532_05930 [Candidatus Lokiarchaeota archaeon]